MTQMSSNDNSELKLDIINAFGADLKAQIRDNIVFISDKHCIIYPVARHLVIREISAHERGKSNHNLHFIYLEPDLVRISSLNVSHENNIFILCEEKPTYSSISLYYLTKINFDSISLYKPKRKVMLSNFTSFIYTAFTSDGNILAALGRETVTTKLKGLIFEVNNYLPFVLNRWKPIITFDLPDNTYKLSFEKKILCTSGKFHLSFWFPYTTSIKEYENNLNRAKDYVDHCWISNFKPPTLVALTSENEIFVVEGVFDKHSRYHDKGPIDESLYDKLDRFIVKQHLVNIFNSFDVQATLIKSFNHGLIVGNDIGELLFVNRKTESDKTITYEPMRIIQRKKEANVTSIALSVKDEYLAVAYSTNEIAYINIQANFNKLKNKSFQLPFNLICEGFHVGNISAIDISLQRPIIITVSNQDKTIRVWNYISGHCEFCKIVLLENNEYLLNEMSILSIAIHPNGYYVALSDKEMIWFFHLCYKELRFYGTDRITSEPAKGNCTTLRFSNGGHLLAAVNGRQIHLLKSFTREIYKTIVANHVGTIVTVMFSPNDDYIYSLGTDGYVYQYNLFSFQGERLQAEFVNYIDGGFLYDNSVFSIIGCGTEGKRYAISELCFKPEHDENTMIFSSHITQLSDKISAIVQINTKKCNLKGIAFGTEDGRVILVKYPFHSTKKAWDQVYSHKGRINKLIYNAETNLLFSIGEDGNIFIYCLYEYMDKDTLVFETKINSLAQLGTVLDEGLGDNALFPLQYLQKYDEDMITKEELMAQYTHKEETKTKELNDEIRRVEIEITSRKDAEIMILNGRVKELEEYNKELIVEYNDKINDSVESNRLKFNEQMKAAHDRLMLMQEENAELSNEIDVLKAQHAMNLEKNTLEFQTKFKALEKELKSRVEKLQRERDDFEAKIVLLKDNEQLKLFHNDGEHEFEIKLLREKHKENMKELNTVIDTQKFEIIRLKDQKGKIEIALSDKEKDYNDLLNKVDNQQNLIRSLRQSLSNHEVDKERMVNSLSNTEKLLQEKEKSEVFANKLKNEIYKKNCEIVQCCNEQEKENKEFKATNKLLEKSVNDTMSFLLNKDKENQKLQLLVTNLKGECDKLRKKANILQQSFNEILIKLYEAYHSSASGRSPILIAVDEIYHTYLDSEEIKKKVNSKQLNIDIREELENQIDILQKNMVIVDKGNERKEQYQNNSKKRQLKENSTLLDNCTSLRKKTTDLFKEINNLKGFNRALEKKASNHHTSTKLIKAALLPTLVKNSSMPDLMEAKTPVNNIIQQIQSNYTKSYKSNDVSIDSKDKDRDKHEHCMSINVFK